MWPSVWVLTLVVVMVSCNTTILMNTTSYPTTVASDAGCLCPSVNCKTCSMEKGLCCRSCCQKTCYCTSLDCMKCNGTFPCCQMCCQEGPGRTARIQAGNATSKGSVIVLPASGELVLSNVTIVINQPQVVVRTPDIRPPTLCCNVQTCSLYGCKTSVTCGPQCVLGQGPWSSQDPRCAYPWMCQPQWRDCAPMYTWPYISCTPGWPGYTKT